MLLALTHCSSGSKGFAVKDLTDENYISPDSTQDLNWENQPQSRYVTDIEPIGSQDFPEFVPLPYRRYPNSKDLRHFVRIGLYTGEKEHTIASPAKVTIKYKYPGSEFTSQKLKGNFAIKKNPQNLINLYHQGKLFASNISNLQILSTNPFLPVSINGARYRGHFDIFIKNDKLQVINELYVEDYLKGVINNELGRREKDLIEAIKAQIVAARTYTYRNLGRRKELGFDLYADVRDQVYKGMDTESPLTDMAINDTRGLIMVYDNELIHSYYHSTCGGKTANIHEVWPSEEIPYLTAQSHQDSLGQNFCKASRFSQWKYTWRKNDFLKSIRRNLHTAKPEPDVRVGKIKELIISERTDSGRIKTLKLKTDQGDVIVKGDKVRWLIRRPGTDNILPSSHFTLKITGSKVEATGKGFGHGIGMCQFGVMERARREQSFAFILKSYYNNINIVQIE